MSKLSAEQVDDYMRKAMGMLKPLRDAKLSKSEIHIILGDRLKKAAEHFAASHGQADAWNALYDLMCALQVNGTPDK